MYSGFLHGVETEEIRVGPIPVRAVKSAVIALVGTAPVGPRQQLVLINNANDAAQFGDPIPGFTLAKAIADIQKQGAGTIIAVNIYDPETHLATVTNESKTPVNGKFKLAYAAISNLVIKSDDDATTYVLNSDYKVDVYGNVTVLNSTNMPNDTAVKASYKRFNPALVSSSNFIGTNTSGVRTGLKLYELCFNTFGIKPKIFLTPWYSSVNAIAAELIVQANKYRGIALIDAPVGTTPSGAISGRGPSGSINFNTGSGRAYLLYPHFTAYDIATDADENRPLSIYMAGVIANTDNTEGYWKSPSNRQVFGVTGVERVVSWDWADPTTEANALNEVGITTIVNGFGTGFRTWGNRLASFPVGDTTPDTFISVRRTRDVFHDSLEQAALQFIDVTNITQAGIDQVRDNGNAFVNVLIGRGALLPGSKVIYEKERNPATQLAAGHVVFTLVATPPSPMERITYTSYLDISLYDNIR